MELSCVWEHNGDDTLLYASELPGAYTRGANLEEAMDKMVGEVMSYLRWAGKPVPDSVNVKVVQDVSCGLNVRDADSDVLFDSEREPLTPEEYEMLKALAMRSADAFQQLYDSIPIKDSSQDPVRNTFYGLVPRTAGEMYRHTKSVNAYYFGEINVDADNDGTISQCRARGFEALEKLPDFLTQPPQEGSYGEYWSLRKLMRRFIWHDRIHAKAMLRMALRNGYGDRVLNPFCF